MLKRTIQIPIILFLFLLILSCPGPDPDPNSTPDLLVFDDIYSVEVISGNLEYTLNAENFSTSIEKAVYSPDTEDPQTFRVNILFNDFPLILILRCNWEDGIVGIQGDNHTGKLGFDVRYPYFEHAVYLHSFNVTYDFSIEMNEQGVLSSLSFSLITPPNLAAVDEIKYPEWEGKEAEISTLDFELSFTHIGEICVNYTTPENIDVIRQWDTSSIIDNVPAGIDVFQNPEEYLDDLVAYLISTTEDPVKRVKIIHDWIADNIYYYGDYYQAVLNGTDKPRILKAPCEILAEQKAECGGHSCFFRTLCRMADVRIEYIWCYSKASGFEATGELESHVCNAMKINGGLYFMDVTFDNNNYEVDGLQTTEPFKTGFLFMPPEWFKYVHLPRNPVFQTWEADDPQQFLIDANMRFRGITSVTKEFHELGFSFPNPVPGAIEINGNQAVVTLECSDTSPDLYSSSYDDDGNQQYYWMMMEKSGNQYTIRISPDWTGIGYTVLWYKDMDDSWNEMARIRWQVKNPPDHSLPRFFLNHLNFEAHLVSPLQGRLEMGQDYLFQIEVPVAYNIRLYDYDGSDYTNYFNFTNSSGTLWELNYTVNNSIHKRLLVQPADGELYQVCLEFEVID